MPPPNYMQSAYLGAMDSGAYYLGMDAFSPVYTPTINTAMAFTDSGLTMSDMGLTTHPFQNQLQSLQAKIRSGANKIEFEFAGKGKGNAQSGTPEMYGQEEREVMRKLADINKVRTTTHATFSVSGLAGMGQRGFSKQAQHETVQEVQRAIDFAKDATTGGAIVVHTGEWQRPVSHHYGHEGFKLYPGEEEEEQILVVDSRTGDFVQGIAKNRTVEVPVWQTAKDVMNIDHPIQGFDVDGNPTTIHPDDFVTVEHRRIDPTKTDHLFRRVPQYDAEGIRFVTEEVGWDKIVARTQEWNQKHPGDKITEQEYFARLQLDNQILQHRGSSLYHLQRYEGYKEEFEKARELLEFYEHLGENMSEEQKRELLMTKDHFGITGRLGRLGVERNISIPDYLRDVMRDSELNMRYTHEASSSADARANELGRTRSRLKTIDEYGLKETGRALGKLAMEAMDKSDVARKMRTGSELKNWEDLYIAPENWHPGQYGSHPDELLKVVEAGRENFKQMLMHNKGIRDEKKLQELAEKHIKTTFDIGHLNMWRSMMERKQGENDEQFQKRFDDWIFTNLDKLHKANAIGHLHLTDNFGYNDDHVTPGQGNAPVKKFVEWAKSRGYKDFIVEAGSFNGETVMHDAWSYFGVVPWKSMGASPRTFAGFHNAQAGLYAPPNYIVGAYIPSNEWTLWSGVPLE